MDSEKTESVAKFTVKVRQEPLQTPAPLSLERYESIPPDSTARPRKRPYGGNGYSGRSGLSEFVHPGDIGIPQRRTGYISANKRQRVEGHERHRGDERDRPILSAERDTGDISSRRPWAERQDSEVRLVEDSQRSPANGARNRMKTIPKSLLYGLLTRSIRI